MSQSFPADNSVSTLTLIKSTEKDSVLAVPPEVQQSTTVRLLLILQDSNGLYTPDATPQIRIEKDNGTVETDFTNMTQHPVLGAGVYYYDYATGTTLEGKKFIGKWNRTISGTTGTYYADAATSVVDNVADLDTILAATGQTTDAAVYSAAGTPSLQALLKGLVALNQAVSGTVTSATSGANIVASGLSAYATNFFQGSEMYFLTGTNAGISRIVTGFTTGTGTIGVSDSFPNTPGAGDTFVIVSRALAQLLLAPSNNSTAVSLSSYVLGAKGDNAVYAASATASLVAYAKALVTAGIAKQSTITSNGTVTTQVDAARTESSTFWQGALMLFISGVLAGEARIVTGWTNSTSTFSFGGSANTWTTTSTAGDSYILIPCAGTGLMVPGPNATNNSLMADVVGNKSDTAVTVPSSAASLLAYLKGVIQTLQMGVGNVGTFALASGTTETQVYADTATKGTVQFWLDLSALAQAATVRVYRMVDGTNYRLAKSYSYTPGTSAPALYTDVLYTRNGLKVTIQSTVAEGVSRNLPYELLVDVLN